MEKAVQTLNPPEVSPRSVPFSRTAVILLSAEIWPVICAVAGSKPARLKLVLKVYMPGSFPELWLAWGAIQREFGPSAIQGPTGKPGKSVKASGPGNPESA